MPRRLHTPLLHPGAIMLDADQAHHARDVLRLTPGDTVELFDAAGATAAGTIARSDAQGVVVQVDQVQTRGPVMNLTVASAIPKGERADWMVEKLSELGVGRFVPLLTARGVVKAEGKNKLERWRRLATESAKQSRRPGIMQIDDPAPLESVLASPGVATRICFSTAPGAPPIASLASDPTGDVMLLIGPEGGWTERELEQMSDRGVRMARLTETILRIETAAVAGAAIVLTVASPAFNRPGPA